MRDGDDMDSRMTMISFSLEGRANSVFIFLSVAKVIHSYMAFLILGTDGIFGAQIS